MFEGSKDPIGDRMKSYYEGRSQNHLLRRTPAIVRLDGKAFHTFTANLTRPFDEKFIEMMRQTAEYLCKHIQGARVAYVQSDEISILLTDFDRLETQAYFDYNVQKLVSVAAGMASARATQVAEKLGLLQPVSYRDNLPIFDARAFNVPDSEVNNVFIWRQHDCVKNSVNACVQKYLGKKACQEVNTKGRIQELKINGIDWNEIPHHHRMGLVIHRVTRTEEVECPISKDNGKDATALVTRDEWITDWDIPDFVDNPLYIEKFLTQASVDLTKEIVVCGA